jgi:hypothetical protein
MAAERPKEQFVCGNVLASGLPGLNVQLDLSGWSALERRSAHYWYGQYGVNGSFSSQCPTVSVRVNPVPEAQHWNDVGGDRPHLFVDRCVWDAPNARWDVDVPHPIRRRRRWYVAYGVHLGFLAGCAAGLNGSSRRILHGGAVQVDNELTVASLGASGQGKSTLCRVLGHLQLGDEVVCIDHQKRTVSGTPVPGEFAACDLKERPLGLLVLPERSVAGVAIRRVPKAEVVRHLLSAAIRCPGVDASTDLAWASAVAEAVPAIGLAWDQAGVDEPRHALLDWWGS